VFWQKFNQFKRKLDRAIGDRLPKRELSLIETSTATSYPSTIP